MQAQRELDGLRAHVRASPFSDEKSAQALLRLKLLARNPANAPCIYNSDGLQTLAEIAFDMDDVRVPHEASSLEAARIIANALLLQPAIQQTFVDLGYVARVVEFYSQSSANHEFVGARILFLLTYQSNVNFNDLVEQQELVKHINTHLLNHISVYSKRESTHDPMLATALTETLKLIYNAANKCHTQSHVFTQLVSPLIQIVNNTSITSKPLDTPVSQLLNALGIIEWPLSLADNGEGQIQLSNLVDKLIKILDKGISSLPVTELETLLIAPLTILRKVVLLSQEDTNKRLKITLLPQDDERDKPLGQSQTLASRLLRLQSSAGVMVLPEAISGLLFDLSDQDASKFVRNIGYGHAAGYLMTHQISLPEELTADAQAGRKNGPGVEVNPITGQRLESEPQVPLPEMTEEEKEREAERLFVLFERLKATGVVDVENPVKRMQQSGRFEELSDSD